jgi:hypothetical protein
MKAGMYCKNATSWHFSCERNPLGLDLGIVAVGIVDDIDYGGCHEILLSTHAVGCGRHPCNLFAFSGIGSRPMYRRSVAPIQLADEAAQHQPLSF